MESFSGELDTLRADNARLRHLLRLSEEQTRAAASDQATLTGAPTSPVSTASSSANKVRFFELFRCRTDVYAVRWENRRDGRSGWMPAIKGYWRKGMNRAAAPYLALTPEDELTPVIASSLKKRAPGYIKLGFPDPRKMIR